MNEPIIWITIFVLTSLIINTIGIYAVYKKNNWNENTKNYFLCFAAGVLITTPLVIILPHSIEHSENGGLFSLFGFLFMFVISKILRTHFDNKEIAFGITAAIAMGIHSLIDGIIYSVTFKITLFAGIASGIGIVAHKFADGVLTYTFLIKGNIEKKKAFLYAFILAGVMTPLGAFITYPFVRNIDEKILSLLSGFVSGVLLYTSASHLIPEARENEHKHSSIYFISGIIFALLMSIFHKH
jgi:zinc and cadmium transporter